MACTMQHFQVASEAGQCNLALMFTVMYISCSTKILHPAAFTAGSAFICKSAYTSGYLQIIPHVKNTHECMTVPVESHTLHGCACMDDLCQSVVQQHAVRIQCSPGMWNA
mmetsp:Transcript_70232/g.117215  ORF Transcript_70232/g.117215 Transcript_70232/m.117215 type:complete len:110 (+) Transcript_70232:328-657(+)